MGSLSDDMARLCGEIVTMRHLRRAFVQDLVENVARLKASFRESRGRVSRETREERARAVLDLKVAVAGLRHDNLLDLKGARRAWSGVAPAKPRAPKSAKPQAEAEPPSPEAGKPAGTQVRQGSPPAREAIKRPPAKKGGAPGGARPGSKRPGSRPQPKKKA